MARKLKVQDNPDLVRDSFSKAIINTDRSNYVQARNRKKQMLEKNERLERLESEVEKLTNLVDKLLNK